MGEGVAGGKRDRKKKDKQKVRVGLSVFYNMFTPNGKNNLF